MGDKFTVEAWTNGILANHARQVKAGKHDATCEWRKTGHFICNCAYRKRIASGFTETPGPLHYSNPICSRCYKEVEHDGDGFVCDACSLQWSSTNQDDEGEFTDYMGELDVATWDARHPEKESI